MLLKAAVILFVLLAPTAVMAQSPSPTDISECRLKEDDRARLACFDAAARKQGTLPPCKITDAEARRDAQFMSRLLQEGSPKFLTDWDSYYGRGEAPKFCAMRAFIETMAALDPNDVKIMPEILPLEIGTIHGGFYLVWGMPTEAKGYEISLTKVLCGSVLEDLKLHLKSPLAETATIRRAIKPGDARKFFYFCNARNTTEFRFVLDENGNVEVQQSR